MNEPPLLQYVYSTNGVCWILIERIIGAVLPGSELCSPRVWPIMLITLTWIAFPRIEIESHLSLHMLHVFGTVSLQVGVNDENRDA